MKNIAYKLLCMLIGGILLGFNAGRTDGIMHIALYIIGLALINLSIYSIGAQIRRKKCGTDGSVYRDSGKQSKLIR